jgi:hypothetical protein
MIKISRLAVTTASMCVVAGCSSGGGTTPATTVPSQGQYGSYTQSYTVPWVESPNFSDLKSTLKVQASVNGGKARPYTVDTGSVGTAVWAKEVPNIPPGSPSGSVTYSSSGLELTGVWATLPVSFPQAVNANGANVSAQAIVPVLAVTSAKCRGSAVNSVKCTGTIPHMLGVGFGRGTTVQTSPASNPFLNLTEMAAGTMRRGYIIGRGGLSLGLTGSDVTGTWTMQLLTNAGPPATGTHNDWTTPAGGFQVSTDPTLSGTALIDTGLLDMIIEDTSLQRSSGPVDNGTPMAIKLGSSSYNFNVGDSGAQTPISVNYATPSHGTYVNTGLRALGHYDLLFDADGGYLGLRAT